MKDLKELKNNYEDAKKSQNSITDLRNDLFKLLNFKVSITLFLKN